MTYAAFPSRGTSDNDSAGQSSDENRQGIPAPQGASSSPGESRILLELVPDLAEADPQQLRSPRLDAARARQRHLDVPVLDLAQRRFEIEPLLGDPHGDVLDVSGTPKVGRQPWRIKPVTAAEHEGPLYDVLQLADVARPAVGLEDRERLRRHAAHGPAELRRQAPDEVCHEERDVLPPLAERRGGGRGSRPAVEEGPPGAPRPDAPPRPPGRPGR